MTVPRMRPPAVQAGDTVGIIAPAGVVDRVSLERAIQALHEQGLRTKTYRDIFAKHGFLAGDDASRAAELNAAFADPEVKAVFPARGGYGCLRLVDRLDYDIIASHPKVFVGFSDNTVLHAAIIRHANLVTFHGPHLSDGWGRPAGPDELTAEWYWGCLRENEASYPRLLHVPGMQAMIGGQAEGEIVGGNLALVGALLGTPYEPPFRDNLLLIEDVNEPPYRVDRLLTQLLVAGRLQEVAGVLVGDFSGEEAIGPEGEPTVEEVIRERLGQLSCPVLTGLPVGHGRQNVTLPMGTRVQLDADAGSVTLLEAPTHG